MKPVIDHIEMKASFTLSDSGTVEGIAWPYKSADTAGDIIVKGAVTALVNNLPMLRGHDNDLLIGIWDEVKETDDGLYVKGTFNETTLAKGVRSQIKTGRLNGLSIGFRDKGSVRRGKNRIISALDLYEVSIVKNPSHPGARLTGVKSFDQAVAFAAAINAATLQLRN
jgi:HK97 family phage prohead protease